MKKWPLAASVSLLVLVADQLTKLWIRDSVPLYESFSIVPSLFNITHVRNSGGAFSFLAGWDESFRIPFFLGMTVLAIGALLYLLTELRDSQKVLICAVAGVLGGALGNAIDRATLGEVVDFLDVYWGHYHWPAFNVADSFITVGAVTLMVHSLFFAEDSAPAE